MSVYPYRFEPVYREKIWGGRALERLFGRALPEGMNVGESWELADLPQGQSIVANGPDAGRTLNSLLAEKGSDILPARVSPDEGRFPLLLKLLDANDILSLQVHPDRDAASELPAPAKFKTECWYVIESRGGYILKGVKPGVDKDDFRRALTADDRAGDAVLDLLVRFDVKAGDFHYLPAGTVHALGPGVVVAEVQTPSDTTFRVSDWGRGRPIHVEEAIRCIHFEPPAAKPPGCGQDVLVAGEYFTVRRLAVAAGERQKGPAPGESAAWMVLGGDGRVACRDAEEPLALAAGDTVLIPAGAREIAMTAGERMTFLEVTLAQGAGNAGNAGK